MSLLQALRPREIRFPGSGLDSSPSSERHYCSTSLRHLTDIVRSPISDQVDQLPSLPRAQLLLLWKESFGKDAPSKLSKSLMVPILAYRIQELATTGLSPVTVDLLRQIAVSAPLSKRRRINAGSALGVGTRLVRSWKEQVHEVNVVQDGFEHRGKLYSHLSPIAKVITGVQQSGHKFFGLKKHG